MEHHLKFKENSSVFAQKFDDGQNFQLHRGIINLMHGKTAWIARSNLIALYFDSTKLGFTSIRKDMEWLPKYRKYYQDPP